MKSICLYPTGVQFRPDSKRVVVRPFMSGDPVKIQNVLQRAFTLSEEEIDAQLEAVRADFGKRHLDLDESWLRHFGKVIRLLPKDKAVSSNRRLYIGALFSGEYALESAALFNPSLVPHPDQSGLRPGDLRFIVSLRATGEGHISSIEFRAGVILGDHTIALEIATPFVTLPKVESNPRFHKRTFLLKLQEMGLENDWSCAIMDRLDRTFTLRQLDQAQAEARETMPHSVDAQRSLDCLHWLAESNYEIHFSPESTVSERIIFPISANESNGIEDARFVRLVEEDGDVSYYATYTAYNGRVILPQLIETADFLHFRICTLNGSAVQNKGMALFPRRINGHYAMLSRQDDENLLIMFSDNLHFWNEPQVLQTPMEPWEMVKIGNCGSPIETPDGWLVLTHGVGPMRKYCIGALLLDLDNPEKIIGRLKVPLLRPEGNEREGYVPNVVYSCGGILHGNRLVLPYGLSDSASAIVTCDLAEILAAME